jgi:hypothetical protein
MKENIKLPAVYRPTSDSLVEAGGITFRLVAMHQMTYDGDWESAGFYLYLANELIGHFYGTRLTRIFWLCSGPTWR